MRKVLIALASATLLGTLFAPPASADKVDGFHHGMPLAPTPTDVLADCAVTGVAEIEKGMSIQPTHNEYRFPDFQFECEGRTNTGYDGTYFIAAWGDTDGLARTEGDKGTAHGEDTTQGWSDIGTIDVIAGPNTGSGQVKFIRGYEQVGGENIRTGNGGDVKAWGSLNLTGNKTGLHCFVANLGLTPLEVDESDPEQVLITETLLVGDAQIYAPGQYRVDKFSTPLDGPVNDGTCFASGTKKPNLP